MSKYVNLETAIEMINLLYHGYEVEEWLNSLPTIEVSEDCISRDYLLQQVYDAGNGGLVVDLRDIDNAPSVVPSRAEGEWLENENGTYTCSNCQAWLPKEQHYYARYCLHCGARMKGAKEVNVREVENDSVVL